jgi:hypothetical protein
MRKLLADNLAGRYETIHAKMNNLWKGQSHRRQRTQSSILCVNQPHAQYAPDPRQTAVTVFVAMAKSLSIDQFST